jgi:hypothetical protein
LPLIRTVAHYGVLSAGASSVVGRNAHICAHCYGASCETLLTASDAVNPYDRFVYSHLSLENLECVNSALELMSVRDGAFTLSGMSPDDVDSMISLLLTLGLPRGWGCVVVTIP